MFGNGDEDAVQYSLICASVEEVPWDMPLDKGCIFNWINCRRKKHQLGFCRIDLASSGGWTKYCRMTQIV